MQLFRYGRALIVSLCISMFSVALYGQGANGSFTGTIRDASGALVPGATVTVTNAATGTAWRTRSNDSGFYTLPTVPPGNYSLTVEAQGFKRVTENGLTLEVDQVRRMDYKLELGAISESVEVTGTAGQLQTETTQLGTLIT